MTTAWGVAPAARMAATDWVDGGAGGDDVVDDDDVAAQGCADVGTAFAVVFGFFAVEGVGDVAAVVAGEFEGGGDGQRNALVGGAEQHEVVADLFHNHVRVVRCDLPQNVTAVERAGVEKIRADASGFEFELAETQHVGFET